MELGNTVWHRLEQGSLRLAVLWEEYSEELILLDRNAENIRKELPDRYSAVASVVPRQAQVGLTGVPVM